MRANGIEVDLDAGTFIPYAARNGKMEEYCQHATSACNGSQKVLEVIIECDLLRNSYINLSIT